MRQKEVPARVHDIPDAKALRLVPDERKRMLSLVWPFCFLPRDLKDRHRASFDIEPIGECRGMIVAYIIVGRRIVIPEPKHLIYYCWIGERAVGADFYNEVSAELFCRAVMSIEKIRLAPAKTGYRILRAQTCDCVVAPFGSCDDDDLTREPSAFDAIKLM